MLLALVRFENSELLIKQRARDTLRYFAGFIHDTIHTFHPKIFHAYSERCRLRISILPRDNYSNNPKYRTNHAYALVGFITEGCVRRVK